MGSIELTGDEFERFLRTASHGRPIVMINLLHYREQALYAADAGAEACSGREAYARYGAHVVPLLANAGGRTIWAGRIAASVIAPPGERWDDAVLIEYPSNAAFVGMVTSSAYQMIAFHRTAALADSRLIASETTVPFSDQ